ncbi:MAG: hybrid sensor histidine kinase/response regulator [Spirochaetales bacterium]|nr:hybrid sensor histidine kinase/response regulator [Spirochaetales bacterium]
MNTKEKKILCIEDDESNYLLMKRLLKNSDFELIQVEDGLKGLELVKKEAFVLILIDVNIAGLNGYETATRLKMLKNTIPVVALTANKIDRAKERALISGCDGFINKPFNPLTFPKLINEYINGRKDKITNSERMIEAMILNNQAIVCHMEEQIRELKRANQELKELDKMKSRFISLVSHELRTPLSPIVGYLSVLLADTTNFSEREKRILNIIFKSSKRLERLLNNLFTLNLLEQDESLICREEVQLDTLISDLIEDFFLILQKRHLSCDFICEKAIPKIFCDETKIERVFFALLENAVKYTDDGGKISVYLNYPSRYILKKYDLSPNDYVEIIFEDSGIGIPENQLNAIFEKFVELSDIDRHHTSSDGFLGGGAGIGLSLCKGIVKEHKGFIWAENRRSHNGSRFYVILPLENSN